VPQQDERSLSKEFAGYRILGEIGRGGMGVVYKAYDPDLKRTVALKVLLAAEHASEEDITRFFREAESAARLHHPNIVPIHELKVHEGKHYYTMDYIEGESLNILLKRKPLTIRQSLELMEKVAHALEHAHSHGVVHRDLKPANIMVSPDGEPKVTDFGLAKMLGGEERDKGLTQSGVAIGTPEYEAPEQAAGMSKNVDARTDIYAMGCILYEMMVGIPPFVATNAYDVLTMHIGNEPIPPTRRGVRVPSDIETVCLKCLEKVPERRYQSAEEFAADIRRFLDGEPIVARPASAFYRLRKRLAKHRAVALISSGSAAALLILAAVKGVVTVVIIAGAALVLLGLWSYFRIMRERNEAKRQAGLAKEAEAKAIRAADLERQARERTEQALEAEQQWEKVSTQLADAREVQASLLPEKIPQIPGYDFSAFYRSAEELGGDLYDWFPLDQTHVVLAVASVSGKGIPGAMEMARTRTILHVVAPESTNPTQIVTKTNALLARDMKPGTFVTLNLAILDVASGRIACCSAGHNPVYVFRAASGDVESVNANGIAVGVDPGGIFERSLKENSIQLSPGDRFLVCSEGVARATNPSQEIFSKVRLIDFIKANPRANSKDFVIALMRNLREHQGGLKQQHDDITILTVRIPPDKDSFTPSASA